MGHYVRAEWEQEVCGEVVPRQHISKHQKNECIFRQYKCEYCGYVDTYDAIAGTGIIRNRDSLVGDSTNHYNKCEDFPQKCPNECGQQSLKRKEINTHRKTCPLELINCPLETHATGKVLHKVQRKDIEQHKDVCEYRPYTCEFCGCTGTFVSITGNTTSQRTPVKCHYEICEHYPLDCPNKCDDIIKRKDLKAHRESCILELIVCPFSSIGCTAKAPRRDVDSHIQTTTQAHLLLMMKSQQEILQKNEELVRMNKELVNKQRVMAHHFETIIGDLKSRIDQLEKRKRK